MKKRIDVIASEESFSNLSSFSNVEELNKAVRVYRDYIKVTVSRSDVQTRLIALLELLKRHSCKQIGVSYMCKNTIAEKLKLSYRTVQRLVKKLEELSVIRQVSMKRKKDMLQTANAIVIQPVKTDVSDKVTPKKSEKCPTIKTTPSSLKQKIKKHIRNTVAFTTNVDKSVDNFENKANFVAHWVPEQFANLAFSFYHKAEVVQEFWSVVKQCNRVVDYSTEQRAFSKDQELKIAIKAFKDFVMKVKNGVEMYKGEFAYFNGIVNKIMDKMYFDMDFMS